MNIFGIQFGDRKDEDNNYRKSKKPDRCPHCWKLLTEIAIKDENREKWERDYTCPYCHKKL
jgi:DNA-directed RNA polymerase subunit RPC12/RpoP